MAEEFHAISEPTYTHSYECLHCGVVFAVEHPDAFSYMDECPECGNDCPHNIDISPQEG